MMRLARRNNGHLPSNLVCTSGIMGHEVGLDIRIISQILLMRSQTVLVEH
jgi:hypothetical protein